MPAASPRPVFGTVHATAPDGSAGRVWVNFAEWSEQVEIGWQISNGDFLLLHKTRPELTRLVRGHYEDIVNHLRAALSAPTVKRSET